MWYLWNAIVDVSAVAYFRVVDAVRSIVAVVFPAPLMSTIGELGTFLARENSAALASPPRGTIADNASVVNGTPLPTAAS